MASHGSSLSDFCFSTEEECLTATPHDPEGVAGAIEMCLSIGRKLAPSLPAVSGYFNGYGRVYADCGHIEMAAAECDDPYLLPLLIERQQCLMMQVVGEMARRGVDLVLANNNHDGLLTHGCAVWGAHENYLVEKHPLEFTELILPFLVTRIYAGAGGIRFSSGEFVAGVRPLCIERTTGGGTTSDRAIHSTAREEHHVGGMQQRFRYHQILGDGHRSHWNRAVQFGATALALKSVIFDPQLPAELRGVVKSFAADGHWVRTLRRLNRLAKPGAPLTIDPRIVETQRLFLESARRLYGGRSDVPSWIPRLLSDWNSMLDAMEQLDCSWLAARLDCFAKYKLYTEVLESTGADWQTLPTLRGTFNVLALLDQNYHEFSNASSVFCRLENAGVLKHRVGEAIAPGREAEPFVPEVQTRAAARARFLKGHSRATGLLMDWSCVHDLSQRRCRPLFDPFADSYGPWKTLPNVAAYHVLAGGELLERVLRMEASNREAAAVQNQMQ